MSLNKLTPNLMVEDVNRTVEFYQDVLGFEFVMGVIEELQEILPAYQPDRPLDYAMMKCGNVEMMFQAKRSLTRALPVLSDRAIGGTLTIYIELMGLDGISELYDRVKENVTVLKDLHTSFYGMQEFYIEDCNGYILTFAEAAQDGET